jgi:calpain-7
MSKATKKELDKDYSAAFQLYIQSAQSYIGLCASSRDEVQKAKWKSIASKALDRADKLKKAHPDLTNLPKDPFSLGTYLVHVLLIRQLKQYIPYVSLTCFPYAAEQARVVQASSKVNGMSYSHWSDPTIDDFKVQRRVLFSILSNA